MDVSKIKKIINSRKPKDGRPNGAFTSSELADELRVNRATASIEISQSIKDGDVKFVGKHPKKSVTGTWIKVPMYKIVRAK